MQLFDNEKDLILKLTNLVLLVWLISAITFFQIALVDIIMPDPQMAYSEYESLYCGLEDPNNNDDRCPDLYELNKIQEKEAVIKQKKSLFVSTGNIAIVGLGIFLLNKK